MLMTPVDRGPNVLAQLKQGVADLKASCLQLASQPTSIPDMQRLEREVQQSRRQYDELLQRRRKQAAELEDLFTRFQELQLISAGVQQDTPVQRHIKQLQAQLVTTTTQLHEALDTQQQYQDVVQQLKQGHLDFQLQLDKLRADVRKEQEHVTKAKAQLLQVQHARDAAKRDAAAAEQEVASGRAARATLLQQMTATCKAQQLQLQHRSAALDTATAVLHIMRGMQGAVAGASGQRTLHTLRKAAEPRHRNSNSSMQGRQTGAADSSNLQYNSSSSTCCLQDRRHVEEGGNALQDKALIAAPIHSNCDVQVAAGLAAGTAAGPLPCISEQQESSVSGQSQQPDANWEALECASAVECLQQLLSITGCSSEQDLMLHVQAHLQAAASLHEVAIAAAEKGRIELQ